jgi:NADPH2:quinone reductase
VKAIRVMAFGGSEQLHVEDVPPLVPGPEEVVVSLKASGVNPVDAYIRNGTYSLKPELPYTPGIDGAGLVSRIGLNVNNLALGQRVYVSRPKTGTYAEECLCAAENVHVLPTNVSFEQGATLGIPYLTAYRALFQLAQARAGETVLIHGASGGVGIAAVQFAKAHGLQVLGTASTGKGRSLALRSGAHHVFDHSSGEMTEQVAALTAGLGPNLIVEMLANKNLAQDLEIIAKSGKIVVVGNRGPTEVNMRDAMSKGVTIFAMVLFNATINELNEGHAAVRAGLELEMLKPVVGKVFPLQEAQIAHDFVMNPTDGTAGKIVLLP